MNNRPLRFDHREIAVIFSLFVFVTLLMFTVGILVGKGLTQAKYEAKHSNKQNQVAKAEHSEKPVLGTQVKTSDLDHHEHRSSEKKVQETPPLVLEPKHPTTSNELHSVREPADIARNEAEQLLKNPKVKALTDDDVAVHEEQPSHQPEPSARPPIGGLPKGKFIVQIGSYPTQESAESRVNDLKKMGFPYAFFSAKPLGEKKNIWYRVWLGHFPDFDTAKANAEFLQKRGEVKNYLVRRSSEAQG